VIADLPPIGERRQLLRADCSNCFGLCCVALAFSRSSEFANDKPAGQPCDHLEVDFRCDIHPTLPENGFRGCTVFDCFGAGQRVSRQTLGGVSWREAGSDRAEAFAVFPLVRELHEMLWYLSFVAELGRAQSFATQISSAWVETQRLANLAPVDLVAADIESYRIGVGSLLARVSELVRADVVSAPATRPAAHVGPGADLIGARLRGADLRGVNLRGAYLIGADLTGSDLRWTDVLGADFRDAIVNGADFGDALFLTQAQVNAMRGDRTTILPERVERPARWDS
jgi:uncharacterized protein YjbI with pentapeptide repeats